MRTSALLALFAPLLGLAGCDGPSVKIPDSGGDTAIGVDDDSGDAPVSEPDIELGSPSVDLGTVGPGDVATGTFVVRNVGDAKLEADVSVGSGTGFSVDAMALSLLTDEESVVTVSFAGATEGTYTGQVLIESNDPDEPTVVVYVGATVSALAADVDADGYTAADDCDDTDAGVNPGATETWYDGIDQNCDGGSDYDQDADGFDADVDCDDTDAAINPDATEAWYDGVDQDCDNRSDYDQDGDGYESADYSGDDCDDTSASVSPGTPEDIGNGIDDDCDGNTDEPLNTEDLDGDGYSEVEGDCNDADVTISPDASETWYDGLDQNCDGASDYDQDGDGFESADYGGDDCDDTDAAILPGATESWYDGVDQDCDGLSDYDADQDGYDSDAWGGPDCDDADATVNPAAVETYYDGIDQDCDGASDYDADLDGYEIDIFGGDDCDDTDATVNPAAASDPLYDGVDQDCDGASDYDQDGDGQDSDDYGGTDCNDIDPSVYLGAAETWYDGVDSDCSGGNDYDQDGDGYNSASYGGDDCDDTDATINPGVTETWYDGVDGDCSGGSDYDQDGDGVTSSSYGGFDCDDTDSAVSPSIAETCDGVDNDCDGSVDEGVIGTYYYDADADGYGLASSSTLACAAPAGYASLSRDCNDANASVNPGATETCNSVDDDCDGTVDDGAMTTWYRDADTDGYGVSTTSTTSCTAPSGYVASSTDCNDSSAGINPAATETCNGVDEDCDGVVDDGTGSTTYYVDSDGDGYGSASTSTTSCSTPSGYVTSSTDCNDASSTVHPSATETCNGVDDDCDGTVDDGVGGSTTYYADADGDGYGDSATTTTACSAPSGYVTNATDCDDSDATSYPGASEVSYDAADNDCDGYQDEMLADDESDWTIVGSSSSDAIGSALEVSDDLDGDGNPELMIGVSGYNYSSYYTDYGITSFHDVSNSGTNVTVTGGYYEVWGNSYDDKLGWSVAAIDDLDGDGYTEVAFGAVEANTSTWTDDDAGIVYLYDIHGETGSDYAYTTYADAAIEGTATSGYYGYSLAVGDFDGDGTNDLAGGGPGEQTGKGRVYVTFDSDGMDTDLIDATDSNFYVTGVSNYDHLGYSVAFGDFGGDGYDDLVACSPDDDDGYSSAGTCWVVNGASTRGSSSSVRGTTISSVDSAVITGYAASDTVGYTQHSLSVGDLDDDGRDDLAVGVPGYDGYTSGGGGIWVYLGNSLSGSETAATANYLVRGDGSLGTAVRMTEDVTGDGVVDLLGGATTAGSNYGVVYLFEGGQSTGTYTMPSDQYASWTGEASGDAFGSAISGLMDLDGDGTLDFAAAATGNDDGASGAGKVYVIPAYP